MFPRFKPYREKLKESLFPITRRRIFGGNTGFQNLIKGEGKGVKNRALVPLGLRRRLAVDWGKGVFQKPVN